MDLLKNIGLKTTNQRKQILQTLKNAANKHVTAEELFVTLKNNAQNVSLATIYRVLSQLEKLGLVKKLNFENNCSYFELNTAKKHHDHLICNSCGEIIEFFDKKIEERQTSIALEHKFIITDHSLNIFGHCYKCNKEMATK
jgi:Fur family transcriptional regulator, ferric uptake regulator